MMSPKQQVVFDDLCQIWQGSVDKTLFAQKMRAYLTELCGRNYRCQRLLVTMDKAQFAEWVQGVFVFWDQEIVIYTHRDDTSLVGMVHCEEETYRIKYFSNKSLYALEFSQTWNHGENIAGKVALCDGVPAGYGNSGDMYLDHLGWERIKKFLDQALAP